MHPISRSRPCTAQPCRRTPTARRAGGPPRLAVYSVSRALATVALLWFGTQLAASAFDLPGAAPGEPFATIRDTEFELGNHVIRCTWRLDGGRLQLRRVADVVAGAELSLADAEPFRLFLANGKEIRASDMTLAVKPTVQNLAPQPDAPILAARFPGRMLIATFETQDASLRVQWRAILRSGGNAIRQEFQFESKSFPVAVRETRLLEIPGAGTKVVGTVPGSPLVNGNLFFAYEHPDARSAVGAQASASLAFNLALTPGRPVVQSTAIGAVPAGQLRRGFLYYVERERAHPYRPFLHYNAWYDICWGNRKITETECLDVIDQFGRELITRRGVPLASFVWDDGWDDPKTLWRPIEANFPNGFSKILAAARQRQSTLGFWLSPFGGYGKPKDDRIAMGKVQGFETGPEGFSLAGANYYARFQETCSRFITQAGANFFKFDGLARSVYETEAMLRLTRSLRALKPDLFVSITTGTWPSPFWLWYGDSTWRGGGDMGFSGAGSKREQWITYRDQETFRNVVQAAPLYPINSLMTQGFAHARYGTAAEVGSNDAEIQRELRSFFASGTCLQELYVTPEKMTARNWDDLAACARWAHANADVLVDTHWIGGDPGKGEPYGWASWSPHKGILAFRNPGATPNRLTVDIAKAFELPAGAPQTFQLKSPWNDSASTPLLTVRASEAKTFELSPFEVVVFDAMPE